MAAASIAVKYHRAPVAFDVRTTTKTTPSTAAGCGATTTTLSMKTYPAAVTDDADHPAAVVAAAMGASDAPDCMRPAVATEANAVTCDALAVRAANEVAADAIASR